MKRCRDCGEEKALEEFSPAKKSRDGRTSYCRPCLRARHETYRDRARTAPSQRQRASAAPAGQKWCPGCTTYQPLENFGRNRSAANGLNAYCKPCHNKNGNESRKRLYGGSRSYHLMARYGITAAEYDAIEEAQGGLCALCRERPPEHVDHDHVTGKIRGVLCSCCNQGLGNFRDSVAALRAAVTYLERTTWQRERVRPGVYRLTSPRPAAAPSPSSSPLQHLISSRRG
jgi:hypothetical protein